MLWGPRGSCATNQGGNRRPWMLHLKSCCQSGTWAPNTKESPKADGKARETPQKSQLAVYISCDQRCVFLLQRSLLSFWHPSAEKMVKQPPRRTGQKMSHFPRATHGQSRQDLDAQVSTLHHMRFTSHHDRADRTDPRSSTAKGRMSLLLIMEAGSESNGTVHRRKLLSYIARAQWL